MSFTAAKTSFAAGEVSPSLWGHVDLAKYSVGCATLRNCFAAARGGAYSRPGTAFVGQAKQAASIGSTPPRLVPFQFQVGQGYVIEFGDAYARFIANGGYVTETSLAISAATQANPCVLTVPGHAYANGDWVFVVGVGGMTELNGETFIVASANIGSGTFSLLDSFGQPIDASGFGVYGSGGSCARIYTIATPYAAADLRYLKWAQSADLMSLTLVNALEQRGGRYGLQTMCEGGGMANATIIERLG